MKLQNIVDVIEKIAPPELGASWDNSGIQVNPGVEDVQKILFCLDITDQVIDEAIEKEVQMIVSHHPLLFVRPDRIDVNEVTGRYVVKLIKAGIAVYSAHIPFDSAPAGNNGYMAQLLGLENVQFIEGGYGVHGDLKNPATFMEAAKHVEKSLNLPEHYIKAAGNPEMEVKRIILCTGAGGEILYDAAKFDCQMVVTGDVKHNVALDARALGVGLVDAGHYGTEKIFAENFIRQMEEILQDEEVQLINSEIDTNPYL